jgi:hypothetical protein
MCRIGGRLRSTTHCCFTATKLKGEATPVKTAKDQIKHKTVKKGDSKG